jgi:hypothetical protein
VLHGKTLVGCTLILLLTVMLLLVDPFVPITRTYAPLLITPITKTANVSPNPGILGSYVTVSGVGFLPNCGPPGPGVPCVFEIVFTLGGGCGLGIAAVGDQLGIGGGGMGVLGFAPKSFGPLLPFGNLFFVTTDKFGAFSIGVFLGDTFSNTNYSIQGFDGKNTFCIDPFTIVLQLCVIQLGVEQPAGAVLWLSGYAYPDLLPSSCPEVTEQYIDGSGVYGGMILVHQFVQNRTFYTEPITIVPVVLSAQI